MGWRPLLTGPTREEALECATALIRSLPAPGATDQRGAGLAAGSAGFAVCHAVAAQVLADEQAAGLATACLDNAVDVMASLPLSLSLYSGFTGIAWSADLVDRLLPGGIGDRNDEIDLALARAVPRYPQDGPYDLIDGLAGIGVYALARWPRPAAADCLGGVLERLAGRARSEADGAYWWTGESGLAGRRAQLYPNGGVDLGVAHGMAGLLPLLARARALGVGGPAVRVLLDNAVRWLTARLIGSPAGTTVPSFIARDIEPEPARTAWCYGDPGVAIALLLAARDAAEPSWERTGTDLAISAARRPPELTRVTDAGVCHGTAGLAHLFNRLYQMTGEAEIAAAAGFWMERTLEACAGALTADGGPAPWNGPGLLEGAAGVALVLLAACVPAEPVWDQMLLVSTGLDVIVSVP
jgi:lantibiotic biosynthesis protein